MDVHARAPVRVEIAGGGTDLPAWTRERVGLCLNLAIDTYCHAVIVARPDDEVVAAYSQLERAHDATEIGNGLIRESALRYGFRTGFEVHTISEVPSRGSGLGVSSSLAVCLGAAFSRMARLRQGEVGEEVEPQMTVARGGWEVEVGRLGSPIGRQDHMAAAWGGLRLYRFEGDSASVERSFSYEEASWVARHLAVFRLPTGHDARAILRDARDGSVFQAAYEAVPVAVRAIEGRDSRLLGRALDMVYETKKRVAGSVTPAVQAIIDRVNDDRTYDLGARTVYGCTIAGAGGGGHVVAVCDPSAIDSLAEIINLPRLRIAPDVLGARSEGWR